MEHKFGGRLRPKTDEPTNWVDLVHLSNNKLAFIYKRLSTYEQTKRSIYSIKAQDALFDLAKEDGYREEFIHIEERDLGVSGTKGREDRPGLACLMEKIEAGLVEAVYVVHISRLYRDQTLINAFSLGELFKEHNVILVTPQMRYNLKDKVHMRLFRHEVERAADELELMNLRLYGSKKLKAKTGGYAGESIPPGYVIDERKQLEDNNPNPNYHTYQIYEPHAEVVKIIFQQLLLPGMTPTRVARYCKAKGIVFAPFPPNLNTKAHLKTFARTKRNPDGSWPITISQVRSIATNPAYIGWKIWESEVVKKNAFAPIIDETIFWAVQEHFEKSSRPKKSHEPLPLAELLYCGNHDIPKQMAYANKKPTSRSNYYCCDSALRNTCNYISTHILDGPISEAVINQVTLPGLTEQILQKLTNEYQQTKEQAASYRREMKRLETEVENLRANLANSMARGILGDESVKGIEEQIKNRLTRISELADLKRQPIGAIGKLMPEQADIELVKLFLENLKEKWSSQPNSLKNTFLRLLLDKVIIYQNPVTVRVKLFWRVGLEQELLIYKPFDKNSRSKWEESEFELLRQYYETGSKAELLAMFPGRTWTAIKDAASKIDLYRKIVKKRNGPRYTPKEDEIVQRYYAREIDKEEATALTGREVESIRVRANNLGLLKVKPKTTWEWINDGGVSKKEDAFKPSAPAPHS